MSQSVHRSGFARARRAPALAVALLLLCACIPARADGVSGFAELVWSDGKIVRETEDGSTERRDEFESLRQRYNLIWDLRPVSNVRILLGGLFDRTDEDRELLDAVLGSRRTRYRPFADLSLRTPQFLAQVNLARLDERNEEDGFEADRTVRDTVTTTLAWNAAQEFPRVRLQHLFTDTRDADRSQLDAVENFTQLIAEHRFLDRVTLQYRGSLQDRRDRVENSRVRTTSHNGRVSYSDALWDGRTTLSADYSVNWRQTETLAPGGEVDFPQFPIEGLAAIDETPGTGFLGPAPALVDGNRAVSAGINLGLPPLGGDDGPRNLGLAFLEPTSLNVLRVWIDRELELPIAGAFLWQVYVSDDNDVWVPVTPPAPATYNRFESRFDVRFESVAARYFKVVVEPLDGSVPDALEWPEILVTELEAIRRLPAEDVEGTTDTTFHLYSTSARTRLLRERALYHELSYLFRKSGEQASTWTLSNGLSLSQPLGEVYSLTARAAREDGSEQGAERVAYVYSASLQAAPLERLRYNLVFSGFDQERAGFRDHRNSIYFYTITELYRGIDLNFGVGRTYLTDIQRRKSRTDQVNAVATLAPYRWLTFNLIYQDRTTSRLGGLPIADDFTRAREAAATFNPLPTVYLYGSYRVEDRTDIGERDIRSIAVSWSPFPYGSLRLSVRYNETFRSDFDQTEKIFVPSLRWEINPRWFIQVDYQDQSTESAVDSIERNVLTATSRITF